MYRKRYLSLMACCGGDGNLREEDLSVGKPRMSGTPKIVLVGDYGIGKTSLVAKYSNRNLAGYAKTTCFDYSEELIDERKCQVWDTAGSEKYKSMMPMYLRNATVVVIVADITRESDCVHANLREWINIAIKSGPDNARILLAGSKSDLISIEDVKSRCDIVNDLLESGEAIPERVCAVLYPTSAVSGDGVSELFAHIGEHI